MKIEKLEVCKNASGKTTVRPVGSDGYIAPWIVSEEYAAFIVKACNAHDDLVAVLDEIIGMAQIGASLPTSANFRRIEYKAKEALAKARGE